MKVEEMLRGLREGQDPLELSIEKWQDIVDGYGVDEGSDNCALCYTYLRLRCGGCPVAIKTGEPHCINTPYYVACEHELPLSEHVIETAKKEIEFLKSLRVVSEGKKEA